MGLYVYIYTIVSYNWWLYNKTQLYKDVLFVKVDTFYANNAQATVPLDSILRSQQVDVSVKGEEK